MGGHPVEERVFFLAPREDLVQNFDGKFDASVRGLMVDPLPELRDGVEWVVHVTGGDENVRVEEVQHLLVSRAVSFLAEVESFSHPRRELGSGVNREISPEDEIAAVFDLVQRVVAPQGDGGAVFLGELRTQDQCPVVQALADDLGTQPIGCRLECLWMVSPQKGVVVFVEPDTLALEFPRR